MSLVRSLTCRQYNLTKSKLMTLPKGKQFDFNESLIFGRFDLFCRRVVKLIHMFGTVHQFNQLKIHLKSMDGIRQLVAPRAVCGWFLVADPEVVGPGAPPVLSQTCGETPTYVGLGLEGAALDSQVVCGDLWFEAVNHESEVESDAGRWSEEGHQTEGSRFKYRNINTQTPHGTAICLH